MILVDLEVPSMGRIYNFKLDEQVIIAVLLEEIVEMIRQKERCELVGDMERICLCCVDDKRILSREGTLEQYGVINGKRLMLL